MPPPPALVWLEDGDRGNLISNAYEGDRRGCGTPLIQTDAIHIYIASVYQWTDTTSLSALRNTLQNFKHWRQIGSHFVARGWWRSAFDSGRSYRHFRQWVNAKKRVVVGEPVYMYASRYAKVNG